MWFVKTFCIGIFLLAFWVVGLEILRGYDSKDLAGIIGTWFAGFATACAAYFTGRAAISSSIAAKAAENSNRLWKEQASFDVYASKAAFSRARLKWIHGSISQVSDINFGRLNHGSTLSVLSLVNVINGAQKVESETLLNKSILRIDSNYHFIKEESRNAFYQLQEAFYLSKPYCGFNEKEAATIEKLISEFINHVRVIELTYKELLECNTNETSVDACFKCGGSSMHYIKSYMARYELIDAYLELLCNEKGTPAWQLSKSKYVASEKKATMEFAKENKKLQEQLLKYYDELFG